MVNSIIPKLKEFNNSFRRNTHFVRHRYIPAGWTSNFLLGLSQKELYLLKKLVLHQLAKRVDIRNIDGACNKEKYFEQWKRCMDSVLSLNTTWTAENFQNYMKYNLSGTVGDWYDSVGKERYEHVNNDGNTSCYIHKIMSENWN